MSTEIKFIPKDDSTRYVAQNGAVYENVEVQLVDYDRSVASFKNGNSIGALSIMYAIVNNDNGEIIKTFKRKFLFDEKNPLVTFGNDYTIANFLQTVVLKEKVLETVNVLVQDKDADGNLVFEEDGTTPVLVPKLDQNDQPITFERPKLDADGKEILNDVTVRTIVPQKLFSTLKGIASGEITNLIPIIRSDVYGVPFFDIKKDGFGSPSMAELFAIIDHIDEQTRKLYMTNYPLFGLEADNVTPAEIGGVEITDATEVEFDPKKTYVELPIVNAFVPSANTVNAETFKRLFIQYAFANEVDKESIGESFKLV